MQDNYWQKLEQCLSVDRLGVYGLDAPGHRIITARYLWNIAVSESMYAPLQLLEVGLRNAIDHAMVAETKCPAWYDNITLTPWCHSKIGEAKTNISRAGKAIAPGRVISELPFGFWTAMFQSEFEDPKARFLPRGIKATFPHMPKSRHHRKRIKADLDKIRKLRNRIFHHERIIHWKDLPEQYGLIMSFLGWINPDLAELAKVIETFPTVHASGTAPILARLDGHVAALAEMVSPPTPHTDKPIQE